MEKVEIINEGNQLENEDNQIDVSLELKHIKKDYYVNYYFNIFSYWDSVLF